MPATDHILWEKHRVPYISLAVIGPYSHSWGMQSFDGFSSSPIQTTWALQKEVALQKNIEIRDIEFYSTFLEESTFQWAFYHFHCLPTETVKHTGGQEDRRILLINIDKHPPVGHHLLSGDSPKWTHGEHDDTVII